MGNPVLDLGQESTIQLLTEGSFLPLDVSSKAIEVDEVLHYVLVLMHAEIFKVSLRFAFGVMWSKVFS